MTGDGIIGPQGSVDSQAANPDDVGVSEQGEGIVEVGGFGDEQGTRAQPSVMDTDLVTVLQCDGDLPDDRHDLVDLDRFAFALLVDIRECAAFDPLAHDREVRRDGSL